MQLRAYNNLVTDSHLHRRVEQLLHGNGGRASVNAICEEVLLLPPSTDRILMEALVEPLLTGDSRLQFDGDGMVAWVEPPAEEVWRRCRRFAVLDVETTNGGRDQQRIIEIGLCRVEDRRVTHEWTSLANPQRKIPYWVRHLTGITDAVVREAPRFAELVPLLLEELEDAILVAHHARFDVACLNMELSWALGKRMSNRYLCTVELSRRYLPGSRSYRLEALSEWLGLTHERPHRAASDARATAELFCHLLRTAEAPWSEHLRPHPPRAPAGENAETKPPANT
ncbi:MAG: PolC-type DNA polymerase III [Terriglobia bacterium]